MKNNLRVQCNIEKYSQFLGLGLITKECLKKDYGQKNYPLKDQLIKGLAKLR